jgi:hypothetical protein
VIKGWFAGKPLPDVRKLLADLCRKNGAVDPAMLKLAQKLDQLGPPAHLGRPQKKTRTGELSGSKGR